MKLSLDTIILFVQDIDKLQQFYVGLLGLEIIEAYDGWLLLKAGQANIALHKIGEAYQQNEPFKVESNTKLVFEVEEDIHQLRNHFLANGIAMQAVKTFPNYNFYVCDGADAEGNVFQLKQKK
jgi:catechol-2,3-dioxygenase